MKHLALRYALEEGLGQIMEDLIYHLKYLQLDPANDGELLKTFRLQSGKIRSTFQIWLQIETQMKNRDKIIVKETGLKAAMTTQARDDKN